jgi:hypothetical protein
MQKIKWDGKQKQVKHQLQILLSEMGFFDNIKTKKRKINPKLEKEAKQKKEKKTPEFIDLHLEIISKIDEAITKNELQTIKKEEPIEKIKTTQIKKSGIKNPKRSLLETETIHNTFEKNESLFEVERNLSFNQNIQNNNLTPLSNKVTSFNESLNIENIDFVEKIEDNPNLLMGLGLSDRNSNKTQSQKSTDATITKTNLEKAKLELEMRRQDLEEALKIAKQKEEELKKKEEEEKKLEELNKIKQKELEQEKIRKEKQRLLEQKRQEKIYKIKQKELEQEKKRKEKQRLLEEKRQEKINKIKQKALEQENKVKEKQRLEEEKRQEKINKLEQIRLEKEQEINKKLKDKEENDKLLEKQEKITKKLLEKKKDQEAKQEIKTEKSIKKIIPETTIDILDEEVGQALKIIDNLLEKLPEDTIYEFIHSKDFEIYERVVNKYTKK